jgi:hypothetical protein
VIGEWHLGNVVYTVSGYRLYIYLQCLQDATGCSAQILLQRHCETSCQEIVNVPLHLGVRYYECLANRGNFCLMNSLSVCLFTAGSDHCVSQSRDGTGCMELGMSLLLFLLVVFG